MPQLILIRHSQTKQAPEVSSHTWVLTDEGKRRCKVLAECLRSYGIQRIISSEESKARLTAELTATDLGIEWQTAPNLQETKRDSVPYFPDVADFRAAVMRALRDPDKLLFGEEVFNDALHRFSQQVDTLIAEYPDETFAISTHGTVMSLYIAAISEHDALSVWDDLGLPSYIVIDLPDKRLVEIVNEL